MDTRFRLSRRTFLGRISSLAAIGAGSALLQACAPAATPTAAPAAPKAAEPTKAPEAAKPTEAPKAEAKPTEAPKPTAATAAKPADRQIQLTFTARIGPQSEHFDAFGTLAAEQRRTDRPHGADALEDAGALAEIVQLGLRDTDVPAIGRPRVRGDAHQSLRIRKRQRADQHCVHDSEDRDVRADAKRQRENRDRREPWRSNNSPQSVPQVAYQ